MKCERLLILIFLVPVLLFTMLSLEAESGNARTELEKKGYTYNENSFVDCAKKGDLEAAKLFLTEGMDINVQNERGQTALMRAAEYQRAEVVTLLLENGADVNVKSNRNRRTAMMEAASAGNLAIIKQLAARGA